MKDWLEANPDFEAIFSAMSFGALIRLSREQADLSQTDLAFALKCAQSMISRLEAGKTIPTLRTLARIAAETGIDLRVSMNGRMESFDGAAYKQRRRELRRADWHARQAARTRRFYRS